MSALNEFQALTHSIGEYSVDTLGRDSVAALQVIMNPRELSGFVTIAMRDLSNSEQRRAIETMFEVERVFADDIELNYVFVDHIEETVLASSAVPQYSYA